jgi:hypothetical protein
VVKTQTEVGKAKPPRGGKGVGTDMRDDNIERTFKVVATGCLAMIVFPLIFLVCLGVIILNGWVLTYLWNWFVLPLFPQMPMLTLWPAVGLAIIVSYLTFHPRTEIIKSKDGKVYTTVSFLKLIDGLLYPLYVLGFAWLVHRYLM